MRNSALNIAPATYDRRGPTRDELVRSHMPLVRKIAWHMRPMLSQSIEFEDVVQIGLIALVEAARTYEDQGHSFATYASIRIRGDIIDTLRKQATSRRSAVSDRRKINDIRDSLGQQLMREPRSDEVAAALGLDAQQYGQMAGRAEPIHLSAIDDHAIDSTMFFADLADSVETTIDRERLQAALAAMLDQLAEREALVLNLYFIEELNLGEIGLALNVGAARVCQIKKSALDRLRVMFQQYMGDDAV